MVKSKGTLESYIKKLNKALSDGRIRLSADGVGAMNDYLVKFAVATAKESVRRGKVKTPTVARLRATMKKLGDFGSSAAAYADKKLSNFEKAPKSRKSHADKAGLFLAPPRVFTLSRAERMGPPARVYLAGLTEYMGSMLLQTAGGMLKGKKTINEAGVGNAALELGLLDGKIMNMFDNANIRPTFKPASSLDCPPEKPVYDKKKKACRERKPKSSKTPAKKKSKSSKKKSTKGLKDAPVCKGKKADGSKCKSKAKKGTKFCRHHG